MVKPASKKQVITHIKRRFNFSERKACQLVGLSRTGYRYMPRASNDEPTRIRLKALATQYPRYGYLMLHELLKREGLVVNKKAHVPFIHR